MTINNCLKRFELFRAQGNEEQAAFWLDRAKQKGYILPETEKPKKSKE